MKLSILLTLILFFGKIAFSQEITKEEKKEIIKMTKMGNFNSLLGRFGTDYGQNYEDNNILINYRKDENRFVILINVGNKLNHTDYYLTLNSNNFSINKLMKFKQGKLEDFSAISLKDLFNKIGFKFDGRYSNRFDYDLILGSLLQYLVNPRESKLGYWPVPSEKESYVFSYQSDRNPMITVKNYGSFTYLSLNAKEFSINEIDIKESLLDFEKEIYSIVEKKDILRWLEKAQEKTFSGNGDVEREEFYSDHILGFLSDSLLSKYLNFELDKNILFQFAYLFRHEKSIANKYLIKSINAGQYINIFDFRDRLNDKKTNYTKAFKYNVESIENAIWNYEFKKDLIKENVVKINPALDSILKPNGRKKIVIYQNPNMYKSFFEGQAEVSYLFQTDERHLLSSFTKNNYSIYFIDEFSPLKKYILHKYAIKPDSFRTLVFIDEHGYVSKTIEQNSFSDFILLQDEFLKDTIQYDDYEKVRNDNRWINPLTFILKEFTDCNYSEVTINCSLPKAVFLNPNLGFHRGFGGVKFNKPLSSLFYSSSFANILGIKMGGIGTSNSVKNIGIIYRESGSPKLIQENGDMYFEMSDRKARDYFKSEKQIEIEKAIRRDSWGFEWDFSDDVGKLVDNKTRIYENTSNIDLLINGETFNTVENYRLYSTHSSRERVGIRTLRNIENNATWLINVGYWSENPIYYTLRNRGCRTIAKADIENYIRDEKRLYEEALADYKSNRLNLAYQKADSLLYYNEITSFYKSNSNEIINMHIVISNILFNFAKLGKVGNSAYAAYKAFAHFAFLNSVGNEYMKNQSRVNMAFILSYEKSFFKDFLEILPKEIGLNINQYSDINWIQLEEKTSLLKLY
ncbi:hypothetical protein [Spirosoma sordidisoli]|uniref:Uncharacterized protein n=1 Tax=Spirosoma sordidisoli TaxID=2502893 RepID=A0A4Q2UN02_9BACT|nr:hypothetical protein [Spirosoma sordidisoli]RYC68149.1 hypothetical protein EQG79_22120 [Spirosoma sordidisoli]